jgi:hypothetical protein
MKRLDEFLAARGITAGDDDHATSLEAWDSAICAAMGALIDRNAHSEALVIARLRSWEDEP